MLKSTIFQKGIIEAIIDKLRAFIHLYIKKCNIHVNLYLSLSWNKLIKKPCESLIQVFIAFAYMSTYVYTCIYMWNHYNSHVNMASTYIYMLNMQHEYIDMHNLNLVVDNILLLFERSMLMVWICQDKPNICHLQIWQFIVNHLSNM